jgi:hypothetical protein
MFIVMPASAAAQEKLSLSAYIRLRPISIGSSKHLSYTLGIIRLSVPYGSNTWSKLLIL